MSHSRAWCEELQTVFWMWPHQLEQSQVPNLTADKRIYASWNVANFILTDVKHSARDLIRYPPLSFISTWNLTACGINSGCVTQLHKRKLKNRIPSKTGYSPIWLNEKKKKNPKSFFLELKNALWSMYMIYVSAFIHNILPWSAWELIPSWSLENGYPGFVIQKDPKVTWHSSQRNIFQRRNILL